MKSNALREAELGLEEEYRERLEARMQRASNIGRRLAPIFQIANLAENHITRFSFAAERSHRAHKLHDKMSLAFERSIMFVLLYEALDHLCMVLNLLDFEELDLESALDGHGLAGDSAAEVVHLLRVIDEKAQYILDAKKENNISLDFVETLDEKEGITYVTLQHWQDFVPGSIQRSFRDYFKSAREAVHRRLEQKPRFWKNQTIRQYLHRKGHEALLRVIGSLEGARL